MSSVRAVVLGGTGFLGPDVVRALVRRGAEVLIYHRGSHEIELPVRHLHGDRSALLSFLPELRRFAPDVVIDMRPMTESDATVFVSTFAGLVRCCVVVSSSDVYRAYGRVKRTEPGPPDPIPLAEDAPLRTQLFADRDARPHDRAEGLEHYDKILVERTVRSDSRLAATVLRLGFVHGPRSYRHFQFLKAMADGRPAIVLEERYARWRGTYAYSENVAQAIALACTHPAAVGQTYNVGDPEPQSVAELVAALGRAAGWIGDVVSVPSSRLPEDWRSPLALDQEFVLDTSRLRRDLGYREDVPPDEGFARTVAWMRANPPTADDPMGRLELDYAAEDRIIAASR